jgi:hypothetical protein
MGNFIGHCFYRVYCLRGYDCIGGVILFQEYRGYQTKDLAKMADNKDFFYRQSPKIVRTSQSDSRKEEKSFGFCQTVSIGHNYIMSPS